MIVFVLLIVFFILVVDVLVGFSARTVSHLETKNVGTEVRSPDSDVGRKRQNTAPTLY